MTNPLPSYTRSPFDEVAVVVAAAVVDNVAAVAAVVDNVDDVLNSLTF